MKGEAFCGRGEKLYKSFENGICALPRFVILKLGGKVGEGRRQKDDKCVFFLNLFISGLRQT